MWKVTNHSNTRTLFYYNKHVILNFWKFWIEIAAVRNIRTKIDRPNFLENYVAAKQSFDIRFIPLTLASSTSFRTLTVSIIKLGLRELKKEYAVYLRQNREVYRLNYNFAPQIHPEPLKKIFKDYFYEVCWGKKWIWRDVVGIPYDRSKFQENFKLENDMSICPYCDLTTIPSKRSAWVEHFLPKGKFPYVSSNPNNLIPTCTPCNVSGTGKGEGHKNPVKSPLQQQIGDTLEFRVVNDKIEITANADAGVENYLALLKTRERYRERNVQRSVFKTLIETYNLITDGNQAQELDQRFFDYIKVIGTEQGHYFVRKTLLEDIEIIKQL
ncbi:hypothetical protein [Pedobacter sp. D749]|uniref:hypothetical protein n=1 Tax=Pedobacter sp. D749 TaxID=2856523 RepID=UPI001C5990CC|nr:hypothetical protein [Pedobacter sp. D749]QXU43479.1 hypothetical protein KYH19_07815 [Pedobacter sp. D749]